MDGLMHHNFNIRLCKTVKKYPAIYNTELKDYINKDTKEMAWIEVGEEMKCDPKILQKKFQNFRTILVRKLKQIHNRETVNRNYYLYPYIKYIIPYLKTPYNNVTFRKTSTNDTSSEDEANAQLEFETCSDFSVEEENILEETEDNENPIYYEDEEALELSSPKLIKRSHSSGEDEAVNEDNAQQINRNFNRKRPKLTTSDASSSTAALSKTKRLETDDDNYEEAFEVNYKNFKQEINERSVNSRDSSEFPKITSSHTLTGAAERFKRKKRLEVADTNNPTKQFLLSLLPDLGEMTSSQLRHFKSKVILLVEDILKDNTT
ncbi:uncharacterized protein [Eurosta solidaginis]|uniref:uncharacterized protein n=1 Tax=Eurosta solidaginis TaxID=178769 RepID=UPI003530D22B